MLIRCLLVLKVLLWIGLFPIVGHAASSATTQDYALAKQWFDEGFAIEQKAKALSEKMQKETESLEFMRNAIKEQRYPKGETRYSYTEKIARQQEVYNTYRREIYQHYIQMQKKYGQALQEFLRLEKQQPNRDDLMFLIASMYDQGRGVAPATFEKPFSPDHLAAYHWYMKASQLGNYVAQYNLASYYYDGRPGFRVNIPEAYFWYSVSAGEIALPGKRKQSQPYAPSEYMLGKMYIQGRGAKKNTSLGLQYMRQAAKNLYAPAAYELGMLMMYGGLDVPKDPQNSIHYLIVAAEGGHAETFAQLGKMFHTGSPFAKNLAAALVMYNFAYNYETDPATKAKYQKSLQYMLSTVSEKEYKQSEQIAGALLAQGKFYYVLANLMRLQP